MSNVTKDITAEQALQIPQQLKRQGSQQGSLAQPQAQAQEKESQKILSDDPVTLLRRGLFSQPKKVNVESFKNELGQDSSYVKETLRNKLAEYNLNPQTKLQVTKNLFGEIEIQGSLRPSDHEKLTVDLNNNKLFKDSFNRLSQQQPTLNYVDNVVRISKAYGVTNNLFNSLISEQNEHNKLNDIAHRYESLKSSNEIQGDGEMVDTNASNEQNYRFVLNG